MGLAAIVTGVIGVLARVLSDCVFFDDSSHLSSAPPFHHAVLTCFGAILVYRERHIISSILTAARADQAAYDAVWRELLNGPEGGDLEGLHAFASEIASECPDEPIRQLRRPEHQRLLLCDKKAHQVFGTPEEVPPVVSLHQLYAQAVGIVGILTACCLAWTLSSTGVVAIAGVGDASNDAGEDDDGSGDDVDELAQVFGPGCQMWVRSGCLKKPGRALGKLATRYGGDPSRLVDLCRQRLVFDRAADLVTCLGAMRADPSVEILRVRNSMAPEHNGFARAGFRVPPIPLYFGCLLCI
jgi:hypothetical protein